MASIYVASSWRNPYYPEVVKRLKAEGHYVYDFRNPPHGGTGFHWTDVDENAPNWTFEEYEKGLNHPLAECQFAADLEAMQQADTCVLVLPCGRSAHTEAGWMAGKGKRVIVYIPEMVEPGLMYKLFDDVVGNLQADRRLFGRVRCSRSSRGRTSTDGRCRQHWYESIPSRHFSYPVAGTRCSRARCGRGGRRRILPA